MSLWKQMANRYTTLFQSAKFVKIGIMRNYAKHNPTPTCAKKSGSKPTTTCKDDHPKARKAKNIQKTFPFYHLIAFDKECCDTDCHDKDFPSFDKCLYKESDKNKRKYQVTWVECPPLTIKPKKICCFAQTKRPPVVRRKPKEKPSTACEPPKCEKKELKCPKVKMPRCRPVRVPVRCHRVRFPKACWKVKAPYPAFSECARPKLRRKRRSECHCWNEIPMCELLRILNRRLETGNTNMNPCSREK